MPLVFHFSRCEIFLHCMLRLIDDFLGVRFLDFADADVSRFLKGMTLSISRSRNIIIFHFFDDYDVSHVGPNISLMPPGC